MNGYERVIAVLEGRPTGRTPLMPITMMFAADRLGVPYGEYAVDHRKLVEAQILTAEQFEFDHVSVISDPACEASNCGAKVQFFDDQPPAIDETAPLLADKSTLATLKVPDPGVSGITGGRMLNRVRAVELFRRSVGELKGTGVFFTSIASTTWKTAGSANASTPTATGCLTTRRATSMMVIRWCCNLKMTLRVPLLARPAVL